MQLSVEQIIAKVAIQRQKQKQVQKQQQLLKQINQKPTSNKQSKSNPHKISSNKSETPILPNQKEKSALTKKYHDLNKIYKKLKIQLETELKMDKKHNQLIEKLSKVIEKNSKLQTELDSLRTKKSVIEYNERSLNYEENNQRSKSKRFEKNSKRATIYEESIRKSSVCCQCRQKSIKQKSVIEKNEDKKINTKKNQKRPVNLKTQQHSDETTRQPHQHQDNNQLDSQIEQYKEMISSKQISINKLKQMVQKQNELIKSYQSQLLDNNGLKLASSLESKVIEKKHDTRQSRKVQGTIVKVKRQKPCPTMEPYFQNKAMTNRSSDIYASAQFHFMSPSYIQPYDQKTKKKHELISNHQNHKGGIVHINSQISHQMKSMSYGHDQYIESFPSQQEKEHQNPHYYQPYSHSPVSSINETSEFVCGELE